MRGWLLDTNVVSELARARADVRVLAWAQARHEHDLYISILTLAEFEKGIENLAPGAPARARLALAVAAIERRFRNRILPVSNSVIRRWGRLSGRQQREQGAPPPVIDALLAATAIEHDMCLVTRNLRDVAGTNALLLDPWATAMPPD